MPFVVVAANSLHEAFWVERKRMGVVMMHMELIPRF